MNGSNKYREQFDRNAGKPADFDSLFRFEGKELIAKKKIRARSNKKRAAAMTVSAAAAVCAAFVGLTYISSSGLSSEDSGVCELAPMPSETEALSHNTSMEETEYFLSSFISHNDFYSPYLTDDTTENSGGFSLEDADIILRCRVATKAISNYDSIFYELCPLEYYFTDDYDSSLQYYTGEYAAYVTLTNEQGAKFSHIAEFENMITGMYGPKSMNGGFNELQIGCEYIIPLTLCESNGQLGVVWNENTIPMRKTSSGWLFDDNCDKLCSGAQPVINDMEDKCTRSFFIEPSDEAVSLKINTILSESERKFYHIYTEYDNQIDTVVVQDNVAVSYSNTTEVSINDIFGDFYKQITPIRTETDENNQTVLYFDSEDYYNVIMALKEDYLYMGTNAAGENMAVIRPQSGAAYTVILSGMTWEDDASPQTSSTPFSMVCYDEQGRRMFTPTAEAASIE